MSHFFGVHARVTVLCYDAGDAGPITVSLRLSGPRCQAQPRPRKDAPLLYLFLTMVIPYSEICFGFFLFLV